MQCLGNRAVVVTRCALHDFTLTKDRPTPVGEVDLNQRKDLESEWKCGNCRLASECGADQNRPGPSFRRSILTLCLVGVARLAVLVELRTYWCLLSEPLF